MKICQTCKEHKPRNEFYGGGKYPRCKGCDKLAQKKYKEESPYKFRIAAHKKRIKHSYNLDINEYNRLCEKQNNLCFLCEKDNNGFRLAVDHDHKTGKVRGLLCNTCNRAIGLFKDNPELLIKAAKYLRKRRRMKELLSFLKDYGINPIVYGVGTFTLTLFALSLIPTMNWIPKMVVLFILTH